MSTPPGPQAPDSHRFARLAAELALEKKASDAVLLDLRELTSVTDYFALVTAESEPQIKAVVARIKEGLAGEGQTPWHVEGQDNRQWVVLDYVDFVVHVFRAETRENYLLERLWGDAPGRTWVHATIREAVRDALREAFPDAMGEDVEVEVEVPRDRDHGDFATNACLGLARDLKRPPRAIAEALLPALRARTDVFDAVEVAGPGFINFRIAPARIHDGLAQLLDRDRDYGRSDAGAGRSVLVEFVSANPTGPLNVVSARAAAFGGTLTRLLDAAGFAARSEFYVNDVGGQIDLLGRTMEARCAQARGDTDAELPEDGYQGEYLADLARELDPAEVESRLGGRGEAGRTAALAELAVERMVAGQRRDLQEYGILFDRWYHQHELYPDAVERTLERFRAAGLTEDRDGATWFVATRFGDDQDRVLVRSNGEPTYFLADLAYHTDKHDRGFARAIDIWGPDHHGYIERMQAGMEALGFGRDWLEILIVQQVNLLSGGQPVKMSKRRGEFITLEDLVRDVGKDTAVFFFLQRRAESHLDFDLDLARKQGDENPVFYVKYAHARISGILRKAVEEGAVDAAAVAPGAGTAGADLARLAEPAETALVKTLLRFPGLVAGAAVHREPHRLTGYLREVAQAFHLFYHECRVLTDDAELTRARLALARAARIVLANGLGLMDIDAPERM